ncbi:hypothetical protein Tsubulata_020302 [Turnera subulata]|uniref:Ubiquitin carboxyl-terminal hydrolase n=1 Tax=Turnera subulata TaxID=218843 RepID=A0A9Q0G4V0_9ROSI|nr:hypothetical protein Tsubulata_020302 [Turnera subulata]
MTRLAEKLSLALLITKSTHSLSLQLLRFSLSTFRLFKTLLKTLSPLPPAMDDADIFSSSPHAADDDDDRRFFDLAPSSSGFTSPYHRHRPSLFHDDYQIEKLYLVPYRWWEEARSESQDGRTGVLYRLASDGDDFGDEIELLLSKANQSGDDEGDASGEEKFSDRACALISESMWVWALYRLRDSSVSLKGIGSLFTLEDQFPDAFPLQIRLSVSLATYALRVKINAKDNMVAFYTKACSMFGPHSELAYIWDFSGQTTQFLMNDRTEIPLELHIHGFADMMKMSDERIDAMTENVKMETTLGAGSAIMNGNTDYYNSYSAPINLHSVESCKGVQFMGLRGMQNLGNTCFMNSAIQCLAHTPKLVDFFLGSYTKEINYENPLGMKGELALAFGDLLRKLWAPGAAPVAPIMFKQTLAKFANQFSGYNQHDSQEFLSFLLDGLHEDLNRVKCKPYIEAKDADGRPDHEVADEYWRNHLARNDSIIVDLCQGQYRSTLTCPHCKTKSVTFDPFMYLSLPLPSTTMRSMTLTVLNTDGNTLPCPVTVSVPKCGRLNDLTEALIVACSLGDDETVLITEVGCEYYVLSNNVIAGFEMSLSLFSPYNGVYLGCISFKSSLLLIFKNRVVNVFRDPSGSLALIRDEDQLVAYRIPRGDETSSSYVVFMHERLERLDRWEKPCEYATSDWKLFGIPLVAKFSALSSGYDLCKNYLKLLHPFVIPSDDEFNDYDGSASVNEDSAMEDATTSTISDIDKGCGSELDYDINSDDFQFYLTCDHKRTEIKMNAPFPMSQYSGPFDVIVKWSEKMIEKFDTCLLSSLPAVFKPQLFTRRPQESISLYKCLEAFLKEEPLGPEDMWFCPSCKRHRQANKKLDLWRLPEVLVVHLKRFSYSRIFKNKLETYVDFPIHDFDLSTHITVKESQLKNKYVLFAISNHYGGMGGGHYTAFADLGHHNWHDFDDGKVESVAEESIKTSAAYVLFYKRVG